MALNNTNSPPKKSSWKRQIVWLISFAVAFVAVKAYRQHTADGEALAQGTANATASMRALQDQAAKQHPEMPRGEAAREAAASQSQADLAVKSGAQKADAAAGQFLGYYLVNVRSRPDYCKSQGVDITVFVEAFRQHNAAFYAKSRVINARGPYSADALEDMLLQADGTEPGADHPVEHRRCSRTTKRKCCRDLPEPCCFARGGCATVGSAAGEPGTLSGNNGRAVRAPGCYRLGQILTIAT